MCEMVAKIAKTNTALTSKLGRWPTYEEIADTAGIDVSVIRLASMSNRTPISLDRTPPTLHGCVTLKVLFFIIPKLY